MEAAGTECFRFHLLVGAFVLGTLSLAGQVRIPEVPSQFKLDMETAARLRPKLMADSVTAANRYATGRLVFDRLLQTLPATSNKFAWQLRIVENGQLNAYSSPDGGIYVESGLARLAGQSSGLWAALLSHEIAHVLRRDWARRYVYEKYLERTGGATIMLGDPGLPSDSWTDSEKASADFGAILPAIRTAGRPRGTDDDGAGRIPSGFRSCAASSVACGRRRRQSVVVRDASMLGGTRPRTG